MELDRVEITRMGDSSNNSERADERRWHSLIRNSASLLYI